MPVNVYAVACDHVMPSGIVSAADELFIVTPSAAEALSAAVAEWHRRLEVGRSRHRNVEAREVRLVARDVIVLHGAVETEESCRK